MRYIRRVLGSSSSLRGEKLSADSLPAGVAGEHISRPLRPFAPLREYLIAVGGVAALTIACWLVTPVIGYGAISLIFLLGYCSLE